MKKSDRIFYMEESETEIKKIQLDPGLSKYLRLAHLTDPHLCAADERDDEFLHKRAAGRRETFSDNANTAVYGENALVEQFR